MYHCGWTHPHTHTNSPKTLLVRASLWGCSLHTHTPTQTHTLGSFARQLATLMTCVEGHLQHPAPCNYQSRQPPVSVYPIGNGVIHSGWLDNNSLRAHIDGSVGSGWLQLGATFRHIHQRDAGKCWHSHRASGNKNTGFHTGRGEAVKYTESFSCVTCAGATGSTGEASVCVCICVSAISIPYIRTYIRTYTHTYISTYDDHLTSS